MSTTETSQNQSVEYVDPFPELYNDGGIMDKGYHRLTSAGDAASGLVRMMAEHDWRPDAESARRLDGVLETNKTSVDNLENAAFEMLEIMEDKIKEQAKQIAALMTTGQTIEQTKYLSLPNIDQKMIIDFMDSLTEKNA